MTIDRNVTPNWESGVEQTLKFKTHVFRAEDGSEVRTATSIDPRVNWKFRASHFGSRNTGEMFLPGRNQGRLQRIPDPVEKFVATFSSGAFMIPSHYETPTSFVRKFQFEVGDFVFVAEHGFCEVTAINIVATSASGATFEAVVNNAPEDGAHIVHVTRIVRPATSGSGVVFTNTVGERSVDVDLHPPLIRSHVLDGGINFPEYRGYPLYDFKQNWGSQPQHNVSYESRGIDTSYGIPFTRQVGQLINQSTFQFSGFSEEQVRTICTQFIRSRGRHAPFYAPVALPDVPLSQPAMLGSNQVRTALLPPDLAVWDQQVLRNFLIDGPGGTQPIGLVNVEAGFGGSVITLDEPVNADAEGATSLRWMAKSRFANDGLKIQWQTNTVANVSFAVTALIDSFHEIRAGGFRVMFNGYYVVFPTVEFPQSVPNQWDQP